MEPDLIFIEITSKLENNLDFELNYYDTYQEYERIYVLKTLSINSIPIILEKLETIKLIDSVSFNTFLFASSSYTLLLEVSELVEYNSFVLPDYEKTIVNISESIKKFYNKKTRFNTIPLVDEALDDGVSHVVFVILDGMGSYFLNDTTPFFEKYKVADLSAVSPATTASAIPSFDNTCYGSESLYLAWQMYFEKFDEHYECFTGQGYYNHDIPKKEISNIFKRTYFYDDLDTFVTKINPSFDPDGYKTINEMFRMTLKSTKKEKTFTYLYCDEPDHTLHAYGDSKYSHDLISTYDKKFEELSKNLPPDTVLIITADHGHIDTIHTKLYLFNEITSMYKHLPAFEGRFATFFIKEEYLTSFREVFNKYFKYYFNLYSKEELLSSGILGPRPYNEELPSYLGDFTAIAKSDVYLCSLSGHMSKSHHAGMTSKEMITPLIIFKK